MSFDHRDIRRSMDVYTLDNVYLGSILHIRPGMVVQVNKPSKGLAAECSAVSGELLGPMPTQLLGNTGPREQGAAQLYATRSDSARPLGQGVIRIGKWWGLLGRRTIPLAEVQTVSLERVMLRKRQDELDGCGRGWRSRLPWRLVP